MYISNGYIGRRFTPGEILPDDLPEEEVKWLLEAGAIRKAAPAPASSVRDETDEAEKERERAMLRKNYEAQLAALGYGPDGNPLSDVPKEDKPDDDAPDDDAPDNGEPEDEIDEEAEAPEIDAMDGIVSEAEEPKTKRTTAPRGAGKKTRGRKA